MGINTWQEAREAAEKLAHRTPRWCDVRGADGEFPPAPTKEAMDDCIALSAIQLKETLSRENKYYRVTTIEGLIKKEIEYWHNEVPVGDFDAVCYF